MYKNEKKLRNYRFRITNCHIDFYLNMVYTKAVNLLECLLGEIKFSYFSQEVETKLLQDIEQIRIDFLKLDGAAGS